MKSIENFLLRLKFVFVLEKGSVTQELLRDKIFYPSMNSNEFFLFMVKLVFEFDKDSVEQEF